MKLFEQTKTFQGRIPVEDVSLAEDPREGMLLSFRLADPQILAEERAGKGAASASGEAEDGGLAPAGLGIEDLSVLRSLL